MDLDLITMDKTEARKAFLGYRRAVRERHDAEDAQIMRGYRALARGHQLIRLSEAVRAGGLTDISWRRRKWNGDWERLTRMVPRLAVARASARMVWTHGLRTDGEIEMRTKRELANSNRRDRTVIGGFPVNDKHASSGWGNPVIRAIVPTVPPPLRPAHSLDGYHILFEAEWAIDPQPPVDPALLKHIGGDLYAVVAVWDLTEIERAVLATRVAE